RGRGPLRLRAREPRHLRAGRHGHRADHGAREPPHQGLRPRPGPRAGQRGHDDGLLPVVRPVPPAGVGGVARGAYVVRARPVSPERDGDLNDWYDGTHIPELLAVPGFVSARRYRLVGDDGAPEYLAIYDIEADDLA